MKQMSLRTFAIATSAFACATLLSFSWSEQRGVSLSVESAQARVGRPLTPVSGAGVARRQNRRAAYRYDLVGAGVAAGYYGGYPGGYYGSYGYPGGYYGAYSAGGYPGYYGAYAAGGYPGYYGAYAAGGYPGYYGGYVNRSYVTGRPTLFPRYYGGWSW
jgi:hypothetical protein